MRMLPNRHTEFNIDWIQDKSTGFSTRPTTVLLQVIRNYHGHLSGVYSLAQHPTVDILMTGGRDAACRVWDIRTKVQVHCLSGHEDTVSAILAMPTDPQVGEVCMDCCLSTCNRATGLAGRNVDLAFIHSAGRDG